VAGISSTSSTPFHPTIVPTSTLGGVSVQPTTGLGTLVNSTSSIDPLNNTSTKKVDVKSKEELSSTDLQKIETIKKLMQTNLELASEGPLKNVEVKSKEDFDSTDVKVDLLLIIGRLLQAAALMAIGASIAASFLITPLYLLWTIPSGFLGVLGVALTDIGAPSLGTVGGTEWISPPPSEAPFVPGQPIGAVNEGAANCWLIASLQVLVNNPHFHARFREIPVLATFLERYTAAVASEQKWIAGDGVNAIRQTLGEQMAINTKYAQQEDADQFFNWFFQGHNSPHQLEEWIDANLVCEEQNGQPVFIDGKPIPQLRQNGIIQVSLGESTPRPSFQELFNAYFDDMRFNSRKNCQERVQLFFPDVPEHMVIQLKRFGHSGNPEEEGYKIYDAIDVPQKFSLSSQLVRTGKGADYQCTAFVTHHGYSVRSGHYTAFIKKGDQWWACDDRYVAPISTEQALQSMQSAYIYSFEKVVQAPSPAANPQT